jgi:hypothetical protein
VDAKRTIVAVVAFCLGLATATTAFVTLRSSPRTVVDAIEVAPTRGAGESGLDRKPRPSTKRSGDDKPGRRGRPPGPSDGRPDDQRPDGGAVPVLPPSPAPAGDDGDDASEDSGEDDDGDGEEDDGAGGDD